MKEGLLGGTLSLSSRSEHEEARLHVARWVGSESSAARRLLGRRRRRGGRADGGAAGCRRAAPPRRPPERRTGEGGDRVDDWGAVRARHARGVRLGGLGRRRAEGQGPG